ncbi:MAG: Histone-lysine N-methyltransferase ezh1 [Trizodia sp. TS-e1964]|nr:MAG: Histone-lysine N-methyltransferase ezh1 [Trizodia sp. TS-e1964]
MFAPKRRVPRTNAPGNVILVLSSDEEESPSQRRHARRVPGPPDAEPQTPAGSDLSQGLPGSGTSNVIEISDEDEQGSVEKISPPQLLDNAKTHHLSQSSTEKGACLPSNCNQNATLQEFRVSHLDPMVLRVSSDRNVLDGPYSTIESSPLPACPLEEFNSSQAPSDARKDGDMAILVNNSGVIPTDKIEKTELSPMMPTNQPYPIKTNDQRVLFEGSKFVSHTASNVVSDQNNTKSTASLSNKRRLSSTELNSNISPTDKPIDKSHSSESNAQPKTNVPEDPNISNATLNIEDHAFVVPHLLIDARKGCQYPERAHLLDNSPSHITGGNHSRVLPQLVDKHSPFRNMKRNTSISGNGLRLECVNHPQITLRKFKIKQITTPIKTYSPEVAVPPYQCYFTMKRNVLATDDTKLRYHHYFGENDTGKEFALKDTFDHDLTSSLPKANRQLENGKRWKPYLAKLLSGLDCSELNIFQFLVADLKPLHECLGSTWSLSEIEETRSRILPKDMGLDECMIALGMGKLIAIVPSCESMGLVSSFPRKMNCKIYLSQFRNPKPEIHLEMGNSVPVNVIGRSQTQLSQKPYVTHLESERRGGISDARESSFLFVLNQDQTLDARRGGNKTRFINHSKKHLKNCYARVLLVNGSHRIGLFAQKKIPALEELFFDYGYAINHAKQFVAEEIKAPHPARPRGRPLLKKNFSGKGTTTRKKREPKTSQPDLSINKTTSARALAKKEEKQGDGGEIEEEAEPSGPELADTDRSFDNRLVEDEDTGDEPIVIRRRRRRFGGRRR